MIASLEPAVAVPIAFLPLGIFHKFATVFIRQTRSWKLHVGRTHGDATAMDSLSLRILVRTNTQMAGQDVRQDTRPGPRRSEDGYQVNTVSTVRPPKHTFAMFSMMSFSASGGIHV